MKSRCGIQKVSIVFSLQMAVHFISEMVYSKINKVKVF